MVRNFLSSPEKYKSRLEEGSKGPWTIERFVIQEDSPGSLRLILQSRGCPPGTYTRLTHNSRGVVMSDTLAELIDLRPFFHTVQVSECKRVLIHGLGLGIAVQAALAQEHVEHVDVVEVDQDVINLVEPQLRDPRLHVHWGNALDFKFPPGTCWDFAWHDIWDSICEDNLPDMKTLHRRYGRKVRLGQGSWARSLLNS